MIRRSLILMLLLTAAVVVAFAQRCTLRVLVQARVAASETLWLAGSGPELGNWNPRGFRLVRQNDSLWQGLLPLKSGTNLAFKITRGSWETEALTHDGHVPGNTEVRILHDTTLNLAVSRWKDLEPAASPQTHGQITGEIRYHRALTHPNLLPRDVLVWLPPGYAADSQRRYPVLYMLDAQNVFDPATSTLGYDWRVDEVCDSLIRAGAIAPLLVVGTTSTADRNEEYGYGPQSEVFADFLKSTLKPLIDSQYRTLPDPAHTAIMGSSMGGLSAFVLAWEQPGMFGKAACFSPAFKVIRPGTHLDYVRKMQRLPAPQPLPMLYFYNGTEGLEAVLQPGLDDMMAALRKRDIPFTFVQGQGEAHNEPAWARWVAQPLLLFFGK